MRGPRRPSPRRPVRVDGCHALGDDRHLEGHDVADERRDERQRHSDLHGGRDLGPGGQARVGRAAHVERVGRVVVEPLVDERDADGRDRALRALRGVVPSLLQISIGPDIIGGGNWDVALVADFADAAGLDAYQTHPAHQAVVGYVRSVVAERVAVDFEI